MKVENDNGKIKDVFPNKSPCIGTLQRINGLEMSHLNLSSKSKIKNALTTLTNLYFPDLDNMFWTGQSTSTFIELLTFNCGEAEMLNTFIWLVGAMCNHEFCGLTFIGPWHTVQIKRHVAWCQYEKERNCLLLKQECHSSIDCPFYKENSTKKNRL